jgi:predicted RNA-binding Zn-ribbon protein involved in translation (DUF1610 family)
LTAPENEAVCGICGLPWSPQRAARGGMAEDALKCPNCGTSPERARFRIPKKLARQLAEKPPTSIGSATIQIELTKYADAAQCGKCKRVWWPPRPKSGGLSGQAFRCPNCGFAPAGERR